MRDFTRKMSNHEKLELAISQFSEAHETLERARVDFRETALTLAHFLDITQEEFEHRETEDPEMFYSEIYRRANEMKMIRKTANRLGI